jgi:hypothetical protein
VPGVPELTIRPGHPDFLDLPWDRSVTDWDPALLVDLPKGISRHEVRFLRHERGIYVVKELPTRAARNDYDILRRLEASAAPAVRPIGLVERRHDDPTAERSAALITAYEPFSFSYRELVEGSGFGSRRSQMLDAFAGLLVELHLAGVFWGDCSLSNVLYRFDAEAIETIMVDAETSSIYDAGISDGRRLEDLEIMRINVAGGMADVAAAAGRTLDEADLTLGDDIAARYEGLWNELTRTETIAEGERFRIDERIARINELGFDVEEIDLVPTLDDESRLSIKVKVGGRSFHSRRLKELTGLDTLENQARQILSDVYYHQAGDANATTSTGKNLAAIRWRVTEFAPWLRRLEQLDGVADAVQAYCDLLHHRFVMSHGTGHDVGTDVAFDDWVARGRPGYPLV